MEDHDKANSHSALIAIVIIGLIVIVGGYIFAVRPYYQRKNCNSVAFATARADGAENWTNAQILSARDVIFQDYNQAYLTCMSKN